MALACRIPRCRFIYPLSPLPLFPSLLPSSVLWVFLHPYPLSLGSSSTTMRDIREPQLYSRIDGIRGSSTIGGILSYSQRRGSVDEVLALAEAAGVSDWSEQAEYLKNTIRILYRTFL